MDERTVGYIVIEFNQASGQPGLIDFGDVHSSAEEAQEVADARLAENRAAGRRERYVVGTVTIEDDGY